MNDNTILRIKVPAHLYESVKEQLTINEAKKSGKAFGDWTVVKEKKLPKDGMKKVEEVVEETNENMENKVHTLDELKAAKSKLEKKIEEMEMADKNESVDEASGVEYAWIPAAIAGLGISGSIIKGIISYMKKNNLKGMKGFMQAYKEIGGDAKSTIGSKMTGGMEEAKHEKKEEDK